VVASSGPVETGVFVLGMHRSGTSAVTRLVNLLGPIVPPDEDLVQPTEKNPKGYWESEALVNFQERVLAAVGCHMSCPAPLPSGWERDPRLDTLRRDAPSAVRAVFPTTPWVWKDPRHCLAFSFWQDALDVRPVVVLVNRNPLEIAASAQRIRNEQTKVYTLALWERYLREGLREIAGLRVLVVQYEDVLPDPLGWCGKAHDFLARAGVPVHSPEERDVLPFIDSELRHTAFTSSDFLADPDVTDAQRALYSALEELEGGHEELAQVALPPESATTEALLSERRRALELRRKLDSERTSSWSSKLKRSKYAAPARPLYARGKRLLRALQGGDSA
jgi:hypothetical protein